MLLATQLSSSHVVTVFDCSYEYQVSFIYAHRLQWLSQTSVYCGLDIQNLSQHGHGISSLSPLQIVMFE